MLSVINPSHQFGGGHPHGAAPHHHRSASSSSSAVAAAPDFGFYNMQSFGSNVFSKPNTSSRASKSVSYTSTPPRQQQQPQQAMVPAAAADMYFSSQTLLAAAAAQQARSSTVANSTQSTASTATSRTASRTAATQGQYPAVTSGWAGHPAAYHQAAAAAAFRKASCSRPWTAGMMSYTTSSNCSGCSTTGSDHQGPPASKVARFSDGQYSQQPQNCSRSNPQELHHHSLRRKSVAMHPVPQQQQPQLPPQTLRPTDKDYSKPLFVDCSIEYELPNAPKIPKNSEPILMIHPGYTKKKTENVEGVKGSTVVNPQANMQNAHQPLTPPLVSQDRKILTAKRTLDATHHPHHQKKLSPSMLENCSGVVNMSKPQQVAAAAPKQQQQQVMETMTSLHHRHQMYLRQQQLHQMQQQQQQQQQQQEQAIRRRMSRGKVQPEQQQHQPKMAMHQPQTTTQHQPRCVQLNCQCFEAVNYRRRLLAYQQHHHHQAAMAQAAMIQPGMVNHNNNVVKAGMMPPPPPASSAAAAAAAAAAACQVAGCRPKRSYADMAMADQYLHFQKQSQQAMIAAAAASTHSYHPSHHQMAAGYAAAAAPPPFKQGRFSLY